MDFKSVASTNSATPALAPTHTAPWAAAETRGGARPRLLGGRSGRGHGGAGGRRGVLLHALPQLLAGGLEGLGGGRQGRAAGGRLGLDVVRRHLDGLVTQPHIDVGGGAAPFQPAPEIDEAEPARPLGVGIGALAEGRRDDQAADVGGGRRVLGARAADAERQRRRGGGDENSLAHPNSIEGRKRP